MFTDKAQAIIDQAKDFAFSAGAPALELGALLAAVGEDTEASVLLAECAGLAPAAVRAAVRRERGPEACPGKMPVAEPVRALLEVARELAQQVPDRRRPGLVDLRHLVGAVALSREACLALPAEPLTRAAATAMLAAWYERDYQAPRLDELTERLRLMRAALLAKVFGQDHAVHAFAEGLFNAEVVAAADTQRRSPRALFVFAGPPGVGKTYLAEMAAAHLGRPFRRFDMSAYSGHQQNEALVGMAKSFHAAHPGTLTEFVEKNPGAVLLFDEIEKAHANTIQLFLQILDAGTLEDKFHERNVAFRDTTIIFTTNAGRRLYEKPNESGVHAANAAFHRKTVLDALETERNPQTREPFFPPAICSRLATGYPLLFNHLGVNELERVAGAEFERVAGLLERQYYKRVEFHELLPMTLVLREGARVDARTLRSQVEAFVKTELFRFCQLFRTDRLDEVFARVDRVGFTLDQELVEMAPDIRALFEPAEAPRVLLVAADELAALYRDQVPEVSWRHAATADDALRVLAEEEIDLALVDLWLGQPPGAGAQTLDQFDHVPPAARGLDQGQELLRKVRDRLPGVPVYLLSLEAPDHRGAPSRTVDDELFAACVRGGGARGHLASAFTETLSAGGGERRDQFASRLLDTCRRLHRERQAQRLGQERQVLTFDTAPRLDPDHRTLSILLRQLRFHRAVAAADAGEVVEDIERPRTRFDEVIGAEAAKEELRFFLDYLRNPRRFSALGLRPPKGVLLHGPPGTGKTMLARAMAGESNVAFVAASASGFVTMWQGSGPQSVRDLFARARRYAPAIVFIDEIDAIGRVRTGGAGGAQATENTLNALLTEMDGFTNPAPDRPVFVLAATNFTVEAEGRGSPERSPRTLDPALVRRFSRVILVDLPERAARQRYLALRLASRPSCSVSDRIIALVGERSTGMSIANLESIVEAAARAAAKSGGPLTDQLLEDALETVRFGEARSRDPEAVRRTAWHEAGHTILYWLSGWWPAYVTVVSRGGHGGYMAPGAAQLERRGSSTRGEILADIRVNLGGRGAEIVGYGPAAGLSTGASQDLENATRSAREMVCSHGMSQEWGPLATPELAKYEGALSSPVYLRLNRLANQILREELDRTVALLRQHRDHLETVVGALLANERLTGEELRNLLPPPPSPDPGETGVAGAVAPA